MQRFAAYALIVWCCLPGAADAAPLRANYEPASWKPNPQFARLDTNKDGFLSYQEARADRQAAQQFALYDADLDGRLSEDEFLRLKSAQARQRGGIHVRDGWITSKVKLAVLRAKDLKSAAIHVETIAGVVRLTGEVDDQKQAARVAHLAGRIHGVKSVDSKLQIRTGRQ